MNELKDNDIHSHRSKVRSVGVTKNFVLGQDKENQVDVIKQADITIDEGDFVIVSGPSGSGKSTMLNMLVGLEPPTTGEVIYDSTSIYKLKENDRAFLRLRNIGLVHQQAIWVKSLSVLENVAVPQYLLGHSYRSAIRKARHMLDVVKMGQYAKRVPTELSGGQQQKVSLARALMNDPDFIVADEPTGNLDTDSATVVMDFILGLNQKMNRTILVVTHNLNYLKLATHRYYMKDGVLSKLPDIQTEIPESITEIDELLKNHAQ